MVSWGLLKDELRRDEGVRLKAYKDTVGMWTIGVGHLLGAEKRMTWITKAECEALFDGDLDAAEKLARRLVPDISALDMTIYGPRFRAVVNMAFNLGSRLAKFKRFLAALNARDFALAGTEMARSKWWGQVGERAERLQRMIVEG